MKKIWITGASTGIGKAVAEKFAKEGWKVAISARRGELLKNIAQDNNIFDYPLDVTDEKKVSEVFKNILEDFKNIDTRMLTRIIRDQGAMNGIISNSDKNEQYLIKKLNSSFFWGSTSIMGNWSCILN